MSFELMHSDVSYPEMMQRLGALPLNRLKKIGMVLGIEEKKRFKLVGTISAKPTEEVVNAYNFVMIIKDSNIGRARKAFGHLIQLGYLSTDITDAAKSEKEGTDIARDILVKIEGAGF
jgi:hypothetical protein